MPSDSLEDEMSTTVKILAALGFIAFAAACAREPEPVITPQPEPIVAEPTFNKY